MTQLFWSTDDEKLTNMLINKNIRVRALSIHQNYPNGLGGPQKIPLTQSAEKSDFVPIENLFLPIFPKP